MTKRSSISSSSNSKSEDDKYTSATGWNKAGKHVKNQPSEAQLLNQGSKPFLRNLQLYLVPKASKRKSIMLPVFSSKDNSQGNDNANSEGFNLK